MVPLMMLTRLPVSSVDALASFLSPAAVTPGENAVKSVATAVTGARTTSSVVNRIWRMESPLFARELEQS